MKIKQIKNSIIKAMSERCGFELSASTNIDHHYVMAVKLGHSTPEQVAVSIEADCTITYSQAV
jgi:hypothetical protein